MACWTSKLFPSIAAFTAKNVLFRAKKYLLPFQSVEPVFLFSKSKSLVMLIQMGSCWLNYALPCRCCLEEIRKTHRWVSSVIKTSTPLLNVKHSMIWQCFRHISMAFATKNLCISSSSYLYIKQIPYLIKSKYKQIKKEACYFERSLMELKNI